MRSRSQSIGKEAPFYTDNEDAYHTDDVSGTWVVADGAGGTGVYAGEWAQYLVQNVPAMCIDTVATLTNWLDNHWEPFFNRYQPQSQTDYFLARKFMEEGSGATLAGLHRHQDHMHWFVYGDAVALCFRPVTHDMHASTATLDLFNVTPHLINWQTTLTADGFCSGVWPHQTGQQYALLSDALGQFVLMAFAALQPNNQLLEQLAQQPSRLGSVAQAHIRHWSRCARSFDEAVWSPLCQSLESAEQFLVYIQALRRDQLLTPDDYTCVLIGE